MFNTKTGLRLSQDKPGLGSGPTVFHWDTGILMLALCEPRLLISRTVLIDLRSKMAKPVATDGLFCIHGLDRNGKILDLDYGVAYGLPGRRKSLLSTSAGTLHKFMLHTRLKHTILQK